MTCNFLATRSFTGKLHIWRQTVKMSLVLCQQMWVEKCLQSKIFVEKPGWWRNGAQFWSQKSPNVQVLNVLNVQPHFKPFNFPKLTYTFIFLLSKLQTINSKKRCLDLLWTKSKVENVLGTCATVSSEISHLLLCDGEL